MDDLVTLLVEPSRDGLVLLDDDRGQTTPLQLFHEGLDLGAVSIDGETVLQVR